MIEKTDTNAVLDPLPASILFDIARNESAPQEWRKAAVNLLRKKGYRQAQHPELGFIVRELEKEEQAEKDVIAVVESAIEEELITEGPVRLSPIVTAPSDPILDDKEYYGGEA